MVANLKTRISKIATTNKITLNMSIHLRRKGNNRPASDQTENKSRNRQAQTDNKPGSQDNNGKRRNVRPGSNGRGRGVSQKKTSEKSTTRKVTPIVNPQKKENVVKKFFKRIFGFKK